jgi:hypothetical protein
MEGFDTVGLKEANALLKALKGSFFGFIRVTVREHRTPGATVGNRR